ncbi:MAG TPA: SurA N-terminal domain-containing protein, partial [Rhodothermales bacterium]
MNKIRDNTGIILWILVFAFGVIWVLQDSGGIDAVSNVRSDVIAKVNGETISVEQYSQVLDRQLQAYQEQTGEPMPPQMVDLTRDRVFDALVEDKLREREIERLGIEVTDEEVYNMVLGSNPHPLILSYFGDGQGGVNRTLLQNFIANPEVQADWIQIEQIIRADRRSQKLDNLIAATVRVSDQDVYEEHLRRNLRVDTRYVALRYATIPDDSVQVTDSDLRAFYNENREDYKRERTYTVNYVGLSKDPTAEDSALVVRELEQVRSRFAAAEEDSLFLAQNASERPYVDTWFAANEVDDEIARAVFDNPTPGKMVGPILSAGQGHLIKIIDVQPAEEPVVRAQHILIRADEGDAAARAAARQEAIAVRNRITSGADFAQVAREVS